MTRADKWKRMEAVVSEWRQSGISAEEMSAKTGVSTGTLWRWKKVVVRHLEARGQSNPPVRFLPVHVVGALGERNGADRAKSSIELVLGSGTRVVIPEGFPVELLAQLLSVVARTC